jgi:hypothetical protein
MVVMKTRVKTLRLYCGIKHIEQDSFWNLNEVTSSLLKWIDKDIIPIDTKKLNI